MRIRYQLALVAALRLILNTMHRMVYPFLTIFAAGLGVPPTTLSLALTGRNMTGIIGPFLAPLADARSRKLAMLAGLTCFTAGAGMVALWPSLATFAAGIILALFGKTLFDPAIYAYLGDRIHYRKRATAMGLAEGAWSMAFILGIPAAGFLISRAGWNAPFAVLAVLGVAMFTTIWVVIPMDHRHTVTPSFTANVRAVLGSTPALAGMLTGLWATASNELVNLNFGRWLADSFHLQIAALAGASVVVGLAELGGEGMVATLTDRLGKARSIALGLIANTAAAALLLVIGHSPTGALIGLFILYITFEFTIVSQLPMMTEIVPGSRATALALNGIGSGIGRSIGGLLATVIYDRMGFPAAVIAGGILNSIALLALADMEHRTAVLPWVLMRLQMAVDIMRVKRA